MSLAFRTLSFGIKKGPPQKKKLNNDSKELSTITEDSFRKFDELREKMIGKVETKQKKKVVKKVSKQASIQILSSRKRGYDSENDSESEAEEAVGDVEKKMQKLLDDIRRTNRIFTWGYQLPDIFLRFNDSSLSPSLLTHLSENDIRQPSPIQMQAIPFMMGRKNILASAPTGLCLSERATVSFFNFEGSGKTLAFALPVIDEILGLKRRADYSKSSKLLAIVLEPTRELAAQTYTEFVKYCSGTSISVANFSGEETDITHADILVSTPNRIVFHLDKIDTSLLRWLVVDESDRLFEVIEGQEKCFRNQLGAIYKACDAKCTRVAFFSATFSHEVEKWCKDNIENIGMVCVGERNSSNTSVKQELTYCGTEDGKKVAIRNLLRTAFRPPALVFVQSKDRAVQLVKLLSAIDSNLKVDSINSGKSDKERDDTMERFRNGEIWVLVCTELLGRGLDLSDVGLVINYDLPTSIISYIHRVGRTGRAGKTGHAVTYFTDTDMKYIKSIATVIRQSGFDVPEYLMEMKKVSRDRKKEMLKRAPKRQKIATVIEQVRKQKMAKAAYEKKEKLEAGSSSVKVSKSKKKMRKMTKSKV
ncbi:Protein CBG12508 [Caenorhabditis briggsae]|uniref:Probable ATP-dependent RNA helicase DDX52 n=1 Tax=Caenorhabditis briggsae TaxID=6238 RepID=A8XFX7_CAEBR|nr:Protein CBG12508 [Caenorhabditis briggsae]CAP31481.2 Protein CBG12508 [Caenorhabditis briggsae]